MTTRRKTSELLSLKHIQNDNAYTQLNTSHSDSSSEDIEELMTEANLPLQMIMERYGKDKDSSEEEKECKFFIVY